MSRISIFGGTGYAGSNIAAEAAARGHKVTTYARKPPVEPQHGVVYVTGSVLDPEVRAAALENADVVVVALSPRGDMAELMRSAVSDLAVDAEQARARLAIVGGAGSLLVAPGGPRLVDTPEFPTDYKDEVLTMAAILDDLQAAPEELDWFYVSPPATFGAFVPGEKTGRYRVGDDILVADENGDSEISGTDFAIAFVDEIETPRHRRHRFTVAH